MKNLLKFLRDASISLVQLALPVMFVLQNAGGELGNMTVRSSVLFAFLYSTISLIKHFTVWNGERRNDAKGAMDKGAEQFENAAAVLLCYPFGFILLNTHLIAGSKYFAQMQSLYYVCWAFGAPSAVLFPWLMLAFARRYETLKRQGYCGLFVILALFVFIAYVAKMHMK